MRETLEKILWLVLGGGAATFLAIIVLAVPPNMDEYVHYHPIACHAFPLAVNHAFRAPCDGSLDLAPFGRWLPLRSYTYAGSSTALFYLPLYAAWPSRFGPRLLGVVALVLVASGLAALTRLPLRLTLPLCAFCLPLAFLLIVDTGPVGFQVVLVVWGVVVLRWLLRRPPGARTLAASTALGLMLFLGFEQKPFLVYQLPGVLLLAALLARLPRPDAPEPPATCASDRSARRWRDVVIRLAPAAVAFALPAALLLGAETRRGYPYYYDLSRLRGAISPLDLGTQLEHLASGHFLEYVADFRTFAHRVYGFPGLAASPATWLYWLVLLAIMVAALRAGGHRRRLGFALASCAGALLLTVYLVSLNRLAWGGHHLIGAWPFLLAAVGLALRELWSRGRRLAVLAFLLVIALTQAVLLRSIVARPPAPLSSWELVAIHEQLDRPDGLARSHVIVALDWGSYYLKSLYGPREQLVVYVEPLRERRELQRLQALARKLDRLLAFVKRRDSAADFAMIREAIPGLARRDVAGLRPDATWELWAEP